MPATRLELCHIFLRHGIFIHRAVHRRSEEDRRCDSKQRRRQHVVGYARRRLGNDVRRSGRDEHKIHQTRQSDVLDVPMRRLFPHVERHGLSRDLAEGQRRDKTGGLLRHDDVNLRPFLAQAARNLHRLVGGDAARDAQKDLLVRKNHYFMPPLLRR